MVHRQWPNTRLEGGDGVERYHWSLVSLSCYLGGSVAVARANIQQRQHRGILLILRIQLHNHLILVGWRIDGRNLARSVSGIKSVLDLLRRNALRRESQARRLVPINR